MKSLEGIKVLSIIVFFSIIIICCSGGKVAENSISSKSLKEVPDSAWGKLAQKKIYFGHQSVGKNIMDGVRDLMAENPDIQLNILKAKDPADFGSGVFAHSSVGENMDPWSKMDGFENILQAGLGQKADIVFFKFCFIDVFPDADVDRIFNDYSEKMARLRERYPETTFIYFTVPITSNLTGGKLFVRKTKNLVKTIIGRPVHQTYDNSARKILNEKIREKYKSTGLLFDIAAIESTYPDGRRSTYSKAGKTYYSLISDYTYDGAHLNETGRKQVAKKLLLMLVNID